MLFSLDPAKAHLNLSPQPVKNLPYSNLSGQPKLSLIRAPPLLSVSFPAQRLNGSLTPVHTKHDRSRSYQNTGCNIPNAQT